jgi:Flp pilus assembly pilin Flp
MMKTLLALLNRWISERGQTMAEYGLLIAVIALIVVIVAVTLGSNIAHIFGTTAGKT